MTDNLYNERAEEVLNFAQETIKSSTWEFVCEKLGTNLYKTNLPDKCDFPCYMVKTTINKSKESLVAKMWNATEQDTKDWDPKVTSWEEVDCGNNWKVCSQYNAIAPLIWSRHTVFAQVKLEKENATYLVAYSIDHPKVTHDASKYVMAKVHMSVYEYVDNKNNATDVTRIALVDPCGKIPTWLVELFAGNMVNMFNKWKE